MKLNETRPASFGKMLTPVLIVALICCPVLALDEKPDDVPDWEDDEVAVSIAVSGPAAEEKQEERGREDDEVPLLGVELTRFVDLDIFTFVLSRRATVRLETHGETDIHGLLLDETGTELASDDNSGDGTNFRIVRSLNPGRYLLGVKGVKGPAAPYLLTTSLSNPRQAR